MLLIYVLSRKPDGTNYSTVMWYVLLCLCRRILGPVYDNEKDNWSILTNKEICLMFKKTRYNRDNKVK
jgi:hypothetical protein